MGKKDVRVDAYIARSPEFSRPILTRLRRAVHQACPEVSETIRWGVPQFDYRGPLCGMAAFKAHCRFMLWKAAGNTKIGRHVRLESAADLPPARELSAQIKQAMALNASGVKTARRPAGAKPPVKTPAILAAALRRNPTARAAYDAFPPSHKREYVEWILDAKTDETRQRRLETAVAWIAAGKSRNWKYQSKPAERRA
jgi:hypothetical protein